MTRRRRIRSSSSASATSSCATTASGCEVVQELERRAGRGDPALPAGTALVDGGTLGLDLLPLVTTARGPRPRRRRGSAGAARHRGGPPRRGDLRGGAPAATAAGRSRWAGRPGRAARRRPAGRERSCGDRARRHPAGRDRRRAGARPAAIRRRRCPAAIEITLRRAPSDDGIAAGDAARTGSSPARTQRSARHETATGPDDHASSSWPTSSSWRSSRSALVVDLAAARTPAGHPAQAESAPSASPEPMPMGLAHIPTSNCLPAVPRDGRQSAGLKPVPAIGHPLEGWRDASSATPTSGWAERRPGHAGIPRGGVPQLPQGRPAAARRSRSPIRSCRTSRASTATAATPTCRRAWSAPTRTSAGCATSPTPPPPPEYPHPGPAPDLPDLPPVAPRSAPCRSTTPSARTRPASCATTSRWPRRGRPPRPGRPGCRPRSRRRRPAADDSAGEPRRRVGATRL